MSSPPSLPLHDANVREDASPVFSDDRAEDSDAATSPDLAVEASPEHDVDDDSPGAAAADDERRRSRDPNASYFSDYAAEQTQQQHQRHQQHAEDDDMGSDGCSRALLPHLRSTNDAAEACPADGAGVDASEADEFDDAEFAAALDTRCGAATAATRVPFSAPPAAGSASKGSERRSQSWVDPLRALSTSFAEEVAAAGPPPRAPSQLGSAYPRRQYHDLSDSPVRTSGSRSQPRRDTLPYCGSGPAPLPPPPLLSPSPDPRRAPTHGVVEGEREHGDGRAPRASSSQASTLATIDAVHVLPCVPEAFYAPAPHASGDAGDGRRAAPGTPPRSAMQCRDVPPPRACTAAASEAASPPPRPPAASRSFAAQAPEGSFAAVHTPAVSFINTTAVSSGPVSRVVRARPPRGAPLLLQCTGHIPTPTRTVVIGAVSDSDTEAESDDATVTAGLHTSAYRESAEDCSDRRTSCGSSPALRENRSGTAHRSDRRQCGSRSPTRSGSPLLSTADARMDVSDADAAAACRRARPQLPRTPARDTRAEDEEAEETPDLIDFSVQTEPLERSWQGEGRVAEGDNDSDDGGASLVLCGYSVETLPVGREQHTSEAAAHLSAHAPHKSPLLVTSTSDLGVAARHTAYVTHAVPRHHSATVPRGGSEALPQFDDVLESVEETPSPNGADAAAVYVSPSNRDSLGRTGQPLVPGSLSAAAQRELERREAVHRVLERQSRSTEAHSSTPDSGLRTPRRVCLDGQEGVHMWVTRASSTDYIAAQEQRRGQRLAEEAERARLGLACDVCQAVFPHARDLLLVFLLLAEESHARLRRRSHRRGRGELSADVGAGAAESGAVGYGGGEASGTVSRVTFDVCAEAVNCVLERHGVCCVRATRELCRRIVCWCKRLHAWDGSAAFAATKDTWGGSMTAATPHGHQSGTEEDDAVEYATFVSCVLELAASFPNAAPGF